MAYPDALCILTTYQFVGYFATCVLEGKKLSCRSNPYQAALSDKHKVAALALLKKYKLNGVILQSAETPKGQAFFVSMPPDKT